MYTRKEYTVRELVDSITSYAIGLGAAFGSGLINVDTAMTVGGALLLAARLYVDGGRAIRKFKRYKAKNEQERSR